MKFCAKCGNANTDEAVFCASCGTPMEQAPAAPQASEPVVSVPVTPTYSAPAYSAPMAAAPEEVKNTSTLWLILNIVVTVLCCGGLFSILGIVFAAMGMGAYKKGDYEEMKKKSKLSMIMFIVGLVLGLISLVIGIIAFAASAANGGSLWDSYRYFN